MVWHPSPRAAGMLPRAAHEQDTDCPSVALMLM
jgi:hypothetical protein